MPKVQTTINEMEKNSVGSMVAARVALFHVYDEYPSFTQVYTEGSTEDQESASAFVKQSSDTHCSIQL